MFHPNRLNSKHVILLEHASPVRQTFKQDSRERSMLFRLASAGAPLQLMLGEGSADRRKVRDLGQQGNRKQRPLITEFLNYTY